MVNMHHWKRQVVCLLLISAGFWSCQKEDTPNFSKQLDMEEWQTGRAEQLAQANMVLYWNEKSSTVLAAAPAPPPAQARAFAMVQIAVHDALNAIKPKFEAYALLNEREKTASPLSAVASATYWTIKGTGLAGSFPLDDWLAESLATVPAGESKEAGLLLGKKAAEAIIAKRATDNYAQANVQQPGPDGTLPGEYRSTLPFSNPGMPKIKALHLWGSLMTPFVTESNSQFRPSAPYAVTTTSYEEDFNEVKNKGARVGHNRTAEETEIGVFWVERSSIGWNRFARKLVAAKNLDAWRTARLFALLHTAMADAVSACFEAKYHYFYWRPETAIRLSDDGNSNTVGDPDWLPSYTESPNPTNPALNVNTPPIPDYPSAHASFGGAAAGVLQLFFQTDRIFVQQTSATLPGVTRTYNSISQAARDNSLSRIYVGFHFRNACLKGEEQGMQVAEYIFDHSFRENP